jgi:hypothetical protein
VDHARERLMQIAQRVRPETFVNVAATFRVVRTLASHAQVVDSERLREGCSGGRRSSDNGGVACNVLLIVAAPADLLDAPATRAR